MIRSRATMLLDASPFWSTLSLRLTLVETDSVPTAATDGTRLLFNPSFVLSLSEPARQGLIAHEVAHCAFGHPWRRGGRDPKRANVAMDYAINSVLSDAGFTLPAGALLDPQWSGHSFEWIYDRLTSDQDQDGDQGARDPGAGGEDVMDAPVPSPGTGDQDMEDADVPTQTAEDWAQAVSSVAATIARSQGEGAAGQARTIADMAGAREDWRGILQRWAQQIVKSDYAWSRPSPRYRHLGVILPSLHSEEVGALVIAVDTSGSVDAPMLATMQEQCRAIVDDVRPSAVHVVYCDASVNRVDLFAPGDPVILTPVGGGGTDFRPVFDLVGTDTLDPAPVGIVYMTDLEGTFPSAAPDVPVIWAVPEPRYGRRPSPPFGDIVEVR
jgi:predicted metal-dependent peptidase